MTNGIPTQNRCSPLRAACQVPIPKKFFSLYLNTMTDSRINEETPLLYSAGEPTVSKESDEAITPLPKLQIAILLPFN